MIVDKFIKFLLNVTSPTNFLPIHTIALNKKWEGREAHFI